MNQQSSSRGQLPIGALISAIAVIITTIITAIVAPHWSDWFDHHPPTPTPFIATPSSTSSPTQTPVASSAPELIQKFCVALNDKDYKSAYEQLFSSRYQEQVRYSDFYTGFSGFTCAGQSQFEEIGSDQYVVVYLLNNSLNVKQCRSFSAADFANSGWKIDIVGSVR